MAINQPNKPKPVTKPKKTKEKPAPIPVLSMNEVRDQLFLNGWRNDTLSPLTARPFWKLTRNLIPNDEVVLSALFATNSAYSLTQHAYVLVVTNKQVYQRSSAADVIISKQVKTYSYDKFKGIKLWQDRWLASRIYVDIYFANWRVWKLETADSTSCIHFKKTIESLRTNGQFEINSDPKAQIDLKQLSQELRLESQKIAKESRFPWSKSKREAPEEL